MCPHCAHCQSNFPCMSCKQGVTWSGKNSKALQCDGCDHWIHTHCISTKIGDSTYNGLTNSSNLWLCSDCGLPNNTELIQSYNVSVQNSFSVLNRDVSLDEYTDLDSTIRSDTILLEPQIASTPVTHTRPKVAPKQSLKIANLNCQSIIKNRDRLGAFLESVKPDILIASETFLTADIPTPTELADYDVERRDRPTRRGGVLIGAKKDLLLTREHEPDCEVLWTKINIVGSKTLHLGAFYRPDVSDNTSLSELDVSLARIPTNHCVLLGGDFNLPDFDWSSGSLKTGRKFPEHHNELLKIFGNFGLTQHITDVTRSDPVHGTQNTLDLIASNRPNSVLSATVIPGIADHDAPIVELDMKPVRVIKKPRNVPMYKSAKWEDFQKFATEKCSEILTAPDDTDINVLWTKFTDILRDGTRQFIPHRRQKARVGLPYISSELRRLMRRRDRLYDEIKKARRNVSHHDRADALKSRYS